MRTKQTFTIKRLRTEAEAKLAAHHPARVPARPAGDLLHELQVHQIELEMQNETLRQNQIELEESRDRYIDLYEFAPVGYLTLTRSGQIAEANLTAASILGIERKQLLRWRFDTLVAPIDLDRWRHYFVNALGQRGSQTLELRLNHGDGSWFYAEAKWGLLLGNDATQPMLRIAITDVTERKRAEEQAQTSQERLELALKATSDGLWDWDLSSGVIYRSSHYYKIVDRQADLDTHDFAFFKTTVYPDDLPQVLEAFEAHQQGKTPSIEIEYRIVTRSGELKWINTRGKAVERDADGKPLRMVGTIRDITARKRIELALSEREAEYRAATETAVDGMWMLDAEGRLLAVNDAYIRRSGYSREELLAMRISDLEARESPHDVQLHIEKIRRNGNDRFETRHRAKDGEVWAAEVSASYSATAGGRFFAFVHDLTERKRNQIALQAMNAEMEEIMRFHVVSQTVAAMAHELNQPLNAVATYSEAALRMLLDGNLKPHRLQHALQSNVQQAQRAGRVVHELLEFMNKGEVVTEPVDLNDIVHIALYRIEETGLALFQSRLELDPGLPAVSANRLQVEKVVSNLIQNGIEAMQSAGIHPKNILVTVRTSADGNMAQVTVRDSGPGLDAKTMHRIFDPFFSSKPKGLGMGLAISRAIIDAHGGQLWVESEPGAGASFHFTLPFTK